jgi:hypothetical protein
MQAEAQSILIKENKTGYPQSNRSNILSHFSVPVDLSREHH